MAIVTTDSSKFISLSSSSISSSADRNNRVNFSTILVVQKVLNHFIDLGHMECSEHVRNSPKKYTFVIFESDLLGHQVELTFENVLNIAFIILKWIYF